MNIKVKPAIIWMVLVSWSITKTAYCAQGDKMDDSVKLNVNSLWCPVLEQANFPVFVPTQLPSDLKLKDASFRPVNPKRDYPRSSLKLTFESESTGKKLSIKQFNYDWGPAAYDCPSLWKNHVQYADVDTPAPLPYLLGNDVFWIGANYRNTRAASIIKERTTVEMADCGTKALSNEELILIASSLKLLNTGQYDRIVSKSYAETCFGYPDHINAVNVPISFWSFPTDKSQIKLQIAFPAIKIPSEIMAAHWPLPIESGYRLDSVFVYFGERPTLSESRYHFVYEHKEHKGVTIQILQMNKASPASCTYPPTPDLTQKFKHSMLEANGKEFFYAYRSEQFGPHEIIFQHGDYNYLMLVKSASWTNKEWFLSLLNKFFRK